MLRRRARHRIRINLAVLAGVVTAILGWPATSHAADAPPSAVIIFDGSGSMWGRIGDVSKFEIARETMASVIPEYADTMAFGLIAYGHRRKSDCNDIQTFAHPATGQARALRLALERISPRGKTPIASSLEQAASTLVDRDGGHIVILTDGVENCRKDLCETVSALRQAAPGLTINLIAFGMRQRDVTKIRCITDDGVGRLIVANNRQELQQGLTGLFDAIADGEASTAGGNTQNIPTGKPKIDHGPPRLQLHALRTANGPLLDVPVNWRVIDTAANRPVFEDVTAEPSVTVKKGSYRIEARLGRVSATRDITITDGGERSVHLVLNGAHLDVPDAANLGTGETVTITKKDKATKLPPVLLTGSDATAGTLYFPPGDYIVRRDGDTGSSVKTVSLEAGDTQSVAFETSVGGLTLTAPLNQGGKPAPDVVFKVYNQAGIEMARSASPRPSFQLAAGSYRVVATAGFVQIDRTVEIHRGKTASLILPLKAGRLRLSATGATDGRLNGSLRYSVVSIDPAQGTNPQPEIATSRRTATLTVPAGYYRVTASFGNTNLTASTDIIVNAGTEEHARLTFAPARLKLAIATDGSSPRRHITWDVNTRGDNGNMIPVWSGHGATNDIALAPGTYVVVAGHGKNQKTQEVELIAGRASAVSIALP